MINNNCKEVHIDNIGPTAINPLRAAYQKFYLEVRCPADDLLREIEERERIDAQKWAFVKRIHDTIESGKGAVSCDGYIKYELEQMAKGLVELGYNAKIEKYMETHTGNLYRLVVLLDEEKNDLGK